MPVPAVASWLTECAREFEARVDELNELDGILGDGDHGTNMYRGFQAARDLDFTDCPTANEALRLAGMALVSTVGGASGPLFGTLLLRVGAAWPARPTLAGLARALREGTNGVMARGKAEPGDKTMVDVLLPTVEALETQAASGADLVAGLTHTGEVTSQALAATAGMVANRGRSALRAQISVGVLDPGAVSTALILGTAAQHVAARMPA